MNVSGSAVETLSRHGFTSATIAYGFASVFRIFHKGDVRAEYDVYMLRFAIML